LKEPQTLPPLILHPFSDASALDRLTMSARVSLVLNGLVAGDEVTAVELDRRLVECRYCELRMLFYLGKDLSRWLDQCMEVAVRVEELRASGIGRESFAALLVEDTPGTVMEKLRSWGVVDYQAIFRRALGLHTLFATIPERDVFTDEFLRQHHRYADVLYQHWIESARFRRFRRTDFQFEMYASGEYARLLEKEWGTQ